MGHLQLAGLGEGFLDPPPHLGAAALPAPTGEAKASDKATRPSSPWLGEAFAEGVGVVGLCGLFRPPPQWVRGAVETETSQFCDWI